MYAAYIAIAQIKAFSGISAGWSGHICVYWAKGEGRTNEWGWYLSYSMKLNTLIIALDKIM